MYISVEVCVGMEICRVCYEYVWVEVLMHKSIKCVRVCSHTFLVE